MNSWSQVIDVVKKSKTFLLTAHHMPDADALGSALLIASWLRSLKKKVVVVNEDEVPLWLKFLPDMHYVKVAKNTKPFNYDCAFIFDCGDIERIGQVKKLLIKGKPVINIDHHSSNPKFGTINIVSPKHSSTAELIAELLDLVKFKLNKKTAQLLYAGIMTDTGSFKYDITNSTTHMLASRCLALKVNPAVMQEKLYPPMPGEDMAHFISVIASAKLLFKNRLYSISLDKKQISRFSKTFEWKERVLNFLRTVEGIEVVMIASQMLDGRIRINLRSQSNVDVARIASMVKGGGHPKAAGATLDMSMEAANLKMCSLFKKVLC